MMILRYFAFGAKLREPFITCDGRFEWRLYGVTFGQTAIGILRRTNLKQ
jgi:hypothetical protein